MGYPGHSILHVNFVAVQSSKIYPGSEWTAQKWFRKREVSLIKSNQSEGSGKMCNMLKREERISQERGIYLVLFSHYKVFIGRRFKTDEFRWTGKHLLTVQVPGFHLSCHWFFASFVHLSRLLCTFHGDPQIQLRLRLKCTGIPCIQQLTESPEELWARLTDSVFPSLTLFSFTKTEVSYESFKP